MNYLEEYNKVFMEAFSLTEDELGEEIVMGETKDWDSVGHVRLITSLEDVFDIMFETEDILQLSSYVIGKEILRKYDIEL